MTSTKIPFRIVKSSDFDNNISSMKVLVDQIAAARHFIKEIESGNLSIEFSEDQLKNNQDNALAQSLVSMRNQMRTIAEQEKQRNWITEGLAQFIDILRTNNDNLNSLGSIIISNVIKYVKANQGSLYIINDQDPVNPYMEMIACYAYDRKKHLVKNVGLGEGLVGQCVLEKAPIYMTNLPGDYIKITSGLGEALPKNLLIVPLIVNEVVYGVIEMASFATFEQHHRDFIEKLAESIASTIANVRINEQTKKLLGETQSQAEQMRSQEEEMRQSMEELTATQEEMQRIIKDVEKKEKYLNELLNVSTDSIFTIDKEFRLVSWNRTFAKTLEQFGMRLTKGMNTMDWYPGAEEKAKQIALYNRVFSGESFDFTAASEQNGKSIYHLSIYAPLKTESGTVYEAAIFAKDVTVMMTAQKELQAQEEELRQNMEELKATQEEMAKTEIMMTGQLNAINNSMATIEFSMDGRVLAANEKFFLTTGYSLQEVEGKHHRMFLFPEYANSEAYVKFWKDLNNGLPQTGEFNRVGKGGKEIWISASYTVVTDRDGKPIKVIKLAMDITAEKLQSLDHGGQIAAINNTMAAIEFDLHGKILDANDNFVNTVGYSKKEIVGQHHSMFVDVQTRDAVAYKNFWNDLRNGKAQTGEFKRFGKGGKEIWISASYTPISDPSGKVYKIIKFAQNITAQKLKAVDHEGQIDAIRRSNAVIEFDLAGNIVYVNELFIHALGYERETDLIGRHHSIFVSDFEIKSSEYKKFWEKLERGEFFTGEFQRKKANGQSIWIYGSYNPILNAEGKPYKVVKYAHVVNKNGQQASQKVAVPAL